MKGSGDIYHYTEDDPNDLPEPGERVIICVNNCFYGEGYLKEDKKWYRYCDFAPLENYIRGGVTAWAYFPKLKKKSVKKQESP